MANAKIPSLVTSVTVPYELWKELEVISREENIAKAQMVREGLQWWFDQHTKKNESA